MKKGDAEIERLKSIQRQKEYEGAVKEWNNILNKKKKSWVDKALLSSTGIKTKEDAEKLAAHFRDRYGSGPGSVSKKDKNAFIRLLIELLNIFSAV